MPLSHSDIHRSLTDELNKDRTRGDELLIEVHWPGHGRVPGTYDIHAKVGDLMRCYTFIVVDVDECAIDPPREWGHRCHPTTTCLNTNGKLFDPNQAELKFHPEVCQGRMNVSAHT